MGNGLSCNSRKDKKINIAVVGTCFEGDGPNMKESKIDIELENLESDIKARDLALDKDIMASANTEDSKKTRKKEDKELDKLNVVDPNEVDLNVVGAADDTAGDGFLARVGASVGRAPKPGAPTLDLDQTIKYLWSFKGSGKKQLDMPYETLEYVILAAQTVFQGENMCVEAVIDSNSQFKICGDTHGQFNDLLRIYDCAGTPQKVNYLFLGDYVDRGQNSIETIALQLAYKAKYKDRFIMLRGNHECADINRVYGFYDEVKRRYNPKMWKTFIGCFDFMPACAIIDDKIMCMHGGLSPQFTHSIKGKNPDDAKRKLIGKINDIPRPNPAKSTNSMLTDLMWADPDTHKGWKGNDRGVSVTFGDDEVKRFLQKYDMDLIARAHQVVEDGYEFFASQRLVTIFSAPDYCQEFGNKGGIMVIDPDLTCSFQILKPMSQTNFKKGGSTTNYGQYFEG